MSRRIFLPVMLLLPLSALAQSNATNDGEARFSLNPRAPAFGLRLDPASEPASRPSAAHIAPSSITIKEGWAAFGTVGPMRWAQPLSEDANMAWRLGGGRTPGIPTAAETAGLPKRLNLGLQYRF